MSVDVGVWLQRFAEEVGTAAPTPEEQESLLAMAGTAAHASERIAAPLSCWMAARAGIDPGAAQLIAQRLAGELEAGSR
jgi:Domain of unknown function (DUF6457)